MLSFVFSGELIFKCDFNNNEAGLYTWQQVKTDWKNPDGVSPDWNNGIGFNGAKGRPLDSARAWIEDEVGGQKKVLAVLYPKLKVGSQESGAQWQYDLGKNYDSATVEYKVFFPEGGDWGEGGKLPGFDGGTAPSGCVGVSGDDGFSARIMWRSGSNSSDNEHIYATQYLYYRGKQVTCGDDFWWGKLPQDLEEKDKQLYDACSPMWYAFNRFNYYGSKWPCSYFGKLKPYFAHFKPGEWNTVRTYIRMNDADKTEEKNSNSVIKTWLNDSLVLDLQGLVLRTTDAFAIDAFYFSTFAGGSTSNFAPQTKDQVYYFDDFRIWEGEKPANYDDENGNDETDPSTIISKKTKTKTVPVILLNKREITISVANAKNMKIAIFTVNGRKIVSRIVSGEKTSFTFPKTSKNALIVQIDADGKYFSQKVLLE
jgi:hypothetical protein